MPKLDGNLNQAAWKFAAKENVFYDVSTEKPAADQTESLLLFDSKYIYVAFYCHDAHPEKIIARETVRDASLKNDDNVTFIIDPFYSRNADDFDSFTINPLGTKNTHIAGGAAGKLEWQGDWSASAQRVSDGWIAEMKIPWNIISYPSKTTQTTMGVNFQRFQERTKITSIWSVLGYDQLPEREGRWFGVQPPLRAWKPKISFLPYLLPTGILQGGTSSVRIGLDARYQPTSTLTGVATINPDFGSVEGAVESIAFARGGHFVPDKRPFFVEGGETMIMGHDYQLGALFDSQQIQHVDAGIKLFGKPSNPITLGALATFAPQESNLVTHIRDQFNPSAQASLLVMQHIAPGADNTLAAFSPSYQFGKWSADGTAVQTLGQNAGGMAWTGALNLNDKNLFATLRYRRAGASFTDPLGFVPFNDYKGWEGYMEYGADWRHGTFRRFDLSFFPTWDWHLSGARFRREAGIDFAMITRTDYSFEMNVTGGTFDNTTDFVYGGSFGIGVSNPYHQWNFNFSTGEQASLPYTSFGPALKVRLFHNFDVSLDSFVQVYQGVTQQHILSFNYEISPYRSWGGRMVAQNGRINLYLSYRNAGHGGADTYFLIGDPNGTSFSRQIAVKWVFAI